MKRKWDRLVRQIRRNQIFMLIVGTLLAFVVESLLERLEASRGLPVLLITTVAIAIATAFYYLALGLIARWRTLPPVYVGIQPEKQRGLIFLYSRKDTLLKALEYHKGTLQYVWLVVSSEKEEEALGLKQEIDDFTFYNQPIGNVWAPQEVTNAIERVIVHARSLALDRDEIICDITGGTTTMKAGAIVGSLEHEVKTQMVPARYDDDLNPERAIDVIAVNLW